MIRSALFWFCTLVTFVILPAASVSDEWPAYTADERRIVVWRAVVMAAGFAMAGAMAFAVDAGFTAEWPAWARGVWVAGIFLCLITGLLAWRRLLPDPPL